MRGRSDLAADPLRTWSSTRAVTAIVVALSIAVWSVPAIAAEGGVTLEQIMADPDWIGNGPEAPFWGESGDTVYFERKRPGEKINDLWAVEVGVEGSAPRRVPPSELSSFRRPGGDYSSDHSRYAYELEGDLFVQAADGGAIRQLTRTAERESRPRFLVGDARIAFDRGARTLVFDLESGLVSEPAELRLEDDPVEEKPEFDYLEAKQLRLYRKVAEEKADEEAKLEHERSLQREDPARPALPWYLGDKVEIVERSLSPAGDRVLLVTREKDAEEGRKDVMPNYVTRSGYVETEELRTRVGRDVPRGHGLLLLDLAQRERHEIDLKALPGIQDDPLAELRKQAVEWHVARGADREQVEKALKAPETRAVEIEEIAWSDDGRRLAVQAHSIDNKDRWIATVESIGVRGEPSPNDPSIGAKGEPSPGSPSGARLVPQHRLTDPAWINYRYNDMGWLPDGRTLWYLSEESGYSQLYVRDVESGETRRLTAGDYVVSDPTPDRSGAHVYFQANVDDPGVYEIYRVATATGETEQLTGFGGVNDFVLSPDETRLLVIHSEIDRHPELYVQAAEPRAPARRLTFTVSDEFQAIDWVIPEIVEVPSSHVDRPIYSKLYKPRDFDPAASYPAVVFVHGAGYLQNAHKGWAGYFREFMFHTLLAEHGYLVLDMDYRASAGYGRDWRTAIYRQMGHPELEDLQDGVAWLIANHSVDPERVGVYGGSYGGFMAFMALFRDPDLFAAGAALRPVTDWAHYNHGYTSNILNTPEIDPVAYEVSSPIEYAQNLARPLLIAAGMQDDNVFFQDTVLLVQRLIELKKEDFETAFYPLDPHGFVHPESWLDEYRRIFKLFERWVRRVE